MYYIYGQSGPSLLIESTDSMILILHLSVSTSGRSREGHLTRAKKFSFSSSLDLDVTCSSSLTQLAMVLAATTVSRFKRAAG